MKNTNIDKLFKKNDMITYIRYNEPYVPVLVIWSKTTSELFPVLENHITDYHHEQLHKAGIRTYNDKDYEAMIDTTDDLVF